MSKTTPSANGIARRQFLEGCGAAALTSASPAKVWSAGGPGPIPSPAAGHTIPLNRGWLFGGKLHSGATSPASNDAAFARVDLPHTVAPLSWQKWNPAAWEDVWIYRKHFSVPQAWRGLRLFAHFNRVMSGATVVLNGHVMERHLGGFLPFECEITDTVQESDNVLAIEVDSRWLNVPPSGSMRGPIAVDYLMPGGITGSVELRAMPKIFVRDVYAKPVSVLTPHPGIEILCRVNALGHLPAHARLHAVLKKDGDIISAVSHGAQIGMPDEEIRFTMDRLSGIQLWDVEHPHLYHLETTLLLDERPVHSYSTRIGFRDARFEIDGFFLNGKRLQLFGLDRHELYPYLGFAAPDRLLRRDAEILRRQFNCNSVRCSHYPQSETFLDACDEFGLLVWEELPGWQYIGDETWQDLAIRDVESMVRRDRNHPAVIIWGVRINESRNDPALYKRTRALAKSLDDTRPTSGTMTPSSRENWRTEWAQDVFAFDDYHSAADGTVGILPPVDGFPYLITETVGQFNYRARKGFDLRYRRAGEAMAQMDQAIYHAQAHSRAANHPRIAGTIAWCAFDYASLMNAYNAVKCPGIADMFRLNKLGASFYLAQVDVAVRPVIKPNFYWDFGSNTPMGPGGHAAIFSNCERLELFLNGKHHGTLHPDRESYPNIKSPPFFADLKVDGTAHPELRIDGYVGSTLKLSRSFSSDHTADRFWLHADDIELRADGSDATRLSFGTEDKFGAPRAFAVGEVALKVEGPGVLVGDNPFSLTENGGAGAVYVRTLPGRSGTIRIAARCGEHTSSVEIRARTYSMMTNLPRKS